MNRARRSSVPCNSYRSTCRLRHRSAVETRCRRSPPVGQGDGSPASTRRQQSTATLSGSSAVNVAQPATSHATDQPHAGRQSPVAERQRPKRDVNRAGRRSGHVEPGQPHSCSRRRQHQVRATSPRGQRAACGRPDLAGRRCLCLPDRGARTRPAGRRFRPGRRRPSRAWRVLRPGGDGMASSRSTARNPDTTVGGGAESRAAASCRTVAPALFRRGGERRNRRRGPCG